MDRYMGQPELFATLPRLAPGETAEVPVTALFNEVMLSLTENVSANGQILVRYRSLGAWKEADFAIQMPVDHRNALSWDDDRRAASFVSPRDPAARLFARYVASIVDRVSAGDLSGGDLPGGGPPENSLPRNVRYAAALFEALAAYGMNYVVDPASSFVEMSEDAAALDSLNYPYQTLYYRGGDCDDLSILYCAMLEALGVDTAFITIPGHIYCAFEFGMMGVGDGWNLGDGWGVEGVIEYGGKRWMPVEITVPGEGFYQAWRIGAREWAANLAGGEARLYPMGESWSVYPPVTAPEAGDRLPDLPEEGEIVRRFTEAAKRAGE
jgi:hypothetical protein